MALNTLKDSHCRQARASDKIVKLFDGGGLFLAVLPSGSKTWRQSYRFAGKQQTKSFGPYPDVSLAAAREKRDELKAQLRDGVDPMADRKAGRTAGRTRKWVTLAEATATYWDGRGDVTEAYRANAKRGIEMHLFPLLGERDVASITRNDLLDALKVMNVEGKFVYVRRVRLWVDQVFEWAIEHGHATINPAKLIDSRRAFGHARVENFASLTLREVPEFFARLGMERDLQSVLACRMLALTWVRTKELRLMEWSEIDEAERLWIIPAGKMKRQLDHVVPLSRQALGVLREARTRCRGSKFVWPHEYRLDRPMSENAILYLLYRIGYKGRLTGHGFRSIASTWANERQFDKDAIERQLSHSPVNKVRSAYNRAEYLPVRIEMMQAFADWLDSCNVDAGVAQR